MPLEIIRNDISRVSADVIVNTANPEVCVGAGVDKAIYDAAGTEQLLAARAQIGPMQPGQAAVTPAFGLSAKYIVHTVGPVWEGGAYGEREAVAACYRNSLTLAAELGAESVAFPLIATGTYGFPKDEALKIAVSEIRAFLFGHDMTVLLVVYDRDAFVISEKAFSDIRSYIDEKDVRYAPRDAEARQRRQSGIVRGVLSRKSAKEDAARVDELAKPEPEDIFAEPEPEMTHRTPTASAFGAAPMVAEPLESAQMDDAGYNWEEDTVELDWSIEDVLVKKGETFQQMLFRIIDRKGLTDPEVYKKANIDRKHFSKIRSNVNYNPSKRTALALAMALQLNLDETLDLLGRAGMALSPSNDFDIIVRYYIVHRVWDIYEVNCALFKFGQQTLGV